MTNDKKSLTNQEISRINKEKELYAGFEKDIWSINVNVIAQNLRFRYINSQNTIVRNKSGIIMLSKLTAYIQQEKIDLLDFKDILLGNKIDISKICNSSDDTSIDLFSYTKNTINGKIDLAKFTDMDSLNIDLTRFFKNGVIDIGIFTDSTNNEVINWSKINLKNIVDNNKLMLSKLTDSSINGKIDLFKIPYCINEGKIDISKIKNSINDDSINLFKYTNNTKDGKINIAIFKDGIYRKINHKIFFEDGIVDPDILEDSRIKEIVDLNDANMIKFIDNNKLMLLEFINSTKNEKIDLFNIPYCINNDKIDISKIKNSKEDENIDFFKYTVNITNDKINMRDIIDTYSNKIDLKKINGIFDNKNRLDLGKINFYCEDNAIYKYDGLPSIDGKIFISNFVDSSRNDEKIDPFDLKCFIFDRDGRIDFNMLANDESNLIDVYKINGLIDEKGRLDLSKVIDSGNEFDQVDLSITNFKFESQKSGRIKLNKLTDSKNNGKIDLFVLTGVFFNNKIDINIICNDDFDDNVNFFKFTRNLYNGMIDLGIITDGDENLIDVHRLSELIDENDRIDLSKVTDSSLNGVINTDNIKFDCVGVFTEKLWLSKFTDSKNNGKINLFKLSHVIKNRKIDICRLANSPLDLDIDILKYTTQQLNGKVIIDLFRCGNSNKIYLDAFNGMTSFDNFTTSENDGRFQHDPIDEEYRRYFEYNY